MSNIKAANSSPESIVNSEREFQLARQQAEQISGETLVRDVSRTIAEQREKAQSSDEDEEQKQTKDTAELSRTRQWFRTDGTVSPNETLKWLLELAGKDWEAFLEWQPDPTMDLPQQLQTLSRLYLALLEAALKYAEGENLTEQLERLDALLAQKLVLLMDQKLEQLISLLEETGQNAALDTIRSSLYRQTAGRTLSLQAVHTLFAQGDASGGKNAGFSASRSSSSSYGMIYQSSGKQNIRFQQTYQTQQSSWKEQLRQRNETITNARKGIGEASFKQRTFAACSGKELERANRFAQHINGSGNLFKNPGITARNEEITGLLAAVMSIKGQIYAGENSRTGSIAFSLQNAIEKLIDQYMNRKGASNVYYHTLAAYKQTQNPQRAIEEGQNYAYQQFREKQKDPAYQKSIPYSRESGFFCTLLKSLSPEKDFALGVNILQKDWQNFLYTIGNSLGLSHLSERGAHSPWGVLAEIGEHRTGAGGNVGKLLLGAMVIIVMSVLAVLWFRFI